MGDEYFNALEKVTRNEVPVYFHRTGTERELASLDWLNEYINGNPDYIMKYGAMNGISRNNPVFSL